MTHHLVVEFPGLTGLGGGQQVPQGTLKSTPEGVAWAVSVPGGGKKGKTWL